MEVRSDESTTPALGGGPDARRGDRNPGDADRFAESLLGREVKKLPTLRGRTIITMFYENSTRTRVSFEVAGKWMSGDVINVSSSGSSVAKGESLRDTALTLRAAGADALIIRHSASGAAQQLAEWTAEPGGGGP